MLKIGIILNELDVNKADFDESVQCLTDMQKKALAGRLQGETLEETGKRLGVTRERVRSLKQAAFAKILKQVFIEQLISQIDKRKF